MAEGSSLQCESCHLLHTTLACRYHLPFLLFLKVGGDGSLFIPSSLVGVPLPGAEQTSVMALLSVQEIIILLACIGIVYNLAVVVHRLYFSPLAKFPGPKLAAATLWYEYYYDVVKRGRYTWKIAELHAQYGLLLIS